MKASKIINLKTLLITGGAFIAAGVIAFVVGMSTIGWDFHALDNHNYVDREYHATAEETAAITSVRVRLDSGQIEIRPLDAAHPTAAVYYQVEKDSAEDKPDTTVSLINGKLEIAQRHRWGVRELSAANQFSFGREKIVAYLPATLTRADIELDSGTADIRDITVTNLYIDIDSGWAEMENITAANAKIEIDSGYAEVTNGTMQKLDIDIDSGIVKLDGVDIPVLLIDIDSGTVRGDIKGAKADYIIATNIDSGHSNLKSQPGPTPATGKSIFIEIDSGLVNIDFE